MAKASRLPLSFLPPFALPLIFPFPSLSSSLSPSFRPPFSAAKFGGRLCPPLKIKV